MKRRSTGKSPVGKLALNLKMNLPSDYRKVTSRAVKSLKQYKIYWTPAGGKKVEVHKLVAANEQHARKAFSALPGVTIVRVEEDSASD
jgi:hypothetical protein